MPVSLSLSHIALHSLSLTLLLTPPSHPLHPLTLAFLHPLTVALRHTDTLSCSCLSHSHGYLTHPLHYQSVSTLKHRFHLSVSSLKYDFLIMWFFSCGFVVFGPKFWLELVSCVTLFGSQENARKIFYFVLRLSCLRKFNMRKLRGLRNSGQNLI